MNKFSENIFYYTNKMIKMSFESRLNELKRFIIINNRLPYNENENENEKSLARFFHKIRHEYYWGKKTFSKSYDSCISMGIFEEEFSEFLSRNKSSEKWLNACKNTIREIKKLDEKKSN